VFQNILRYKSQFISVFDVANWFHTQIWEKAARCVVKFNYVYIAPSAWLALAMVVHDMNVSSSAIGCQLWRWFAPRCSSLFVISKDAMTEWHNLLCRLIVCAITPWVFKTSASTASIIPIVLYQENANWNKHVDITCALYLYVKWRSSDSCIIQAIDLWHACVFALTSNNDGHSASQLFE